MTTPTAPPRPSGKFTSLVAVGVLVVAAGLLLPRLLSLSPAPVSAEADTPPNAPEPPPAPADGGSSSSLVWVLAKLLFGLAIVAGACIGVARWSNRARATAPPGILNALAKLAIDNRCVVHLVSAGSRRLLVGIDAGGVKVLLELPPK